jgi:hypothetical protein
MNFRSYATVWFRMISLIMIIEGLAGIIHFCYIKSYYTDKMSWAVQNNDERLFASLEYIVIALIFFLCSNIFGRYVSSGLDD